MRFDTCSSDSTKYFPVFFWHLLFGLRCSMILLDDKIFWSSHGTWESRSVGNALRSPNFWLLFASLRLQIKTFGSYRRCSRAFSTHDFLQLVHVHSMFAFSCGRYLLCRIFGTTLVKFIVTLGLVKVTQTHRGLFIHFVYVICIQPIFSFLSLLNAILNIFDFFINFIVGSFRCSRSRWHHRNFFEILVLGFSKFVHDFTVLFFILAKLVFIYLLENITILYWIMSCFVILIFILIEYLDTKTKILLKIIKCFLGFSLLILDTLENLV